MAAASFVSTPVGPAPLDRDDLEAARAAARTGAQVERVLVTVDLARAAAPDVRAALEEDAAAGVATAVADAANDLPLTAYPLPTLAFAVTDEGARAASGDALDPAAARAAADVLRTTATAPVSPEERRVPEPLAALALEARELASRHCHGAAEWSDDCSAYHGLIPSLRLLGVLETPQRHGRFFQTGVAAATAGRPAPRVLVAGAADTGMLAQVRAGLGAAADRAAITVLDRCATPGRLCAAWADREGFTVERAVGDAARWEGDGPYDVIVTDSLLTLMTPADREAAVARWRAMLAPEGRVVTKVRLAPGGGTAAGRYASAGGFAALVGAAARIRRELLPLAPETIEATTRRFAAGMRVYPLRSADELRALFAGAGLAVESLRVFEQIGRVPAEQAGPGSQRTATYAQIVARA